MQLEASFICDDIRTEEGHKISLMGIYDKGLLLPQIPARLAKLCLYQRWSGVPIGTKLEVELRGSAVAKSVRAQGIAQSGVDISAGTRPHGSAVVDSNLLMVFAPVDIAAAGEIEFLTFWDGRSSPDHRHTIQILKSPPEQSPVH